MKKLFLSILFLATCFNIETSAQSSEKMAATVMQIWKDSLSLADGKPVKWAYDQGVVLLGIEGLWRTTGDGKYFRYMQQCMDFFVDKEGNIRTYKAEDYNIDNILCGRILLTLFKVTGEERYYKAAKQLRDQLNGQPRNTAGGFWHKKRYPNQMWLDGLYMGEPFYAAWSQYFKDEKAFDDIAKQFELIEQHTRDTRTGLLYHAWDESRAEKWADKTTGCSPNFWARAMGWYGLALVDVLPYFPEDHPGRKSLIAILNRFATAVAKVQDNKTGLWWDVLNYPGREGNYYESSASCMLTYTLAKATRLGYLPASYNSAAKKGYDGILKTFVKTDDAGMMRLDGTVSVSGLGGNPYRDGSYEYYISEKVISNDPKGVGAFLQMANEMELQQQLAAGKGKKVLLDCYFNNEFKKDASGTIHSHHYKWNEELNGGFSFLGGVFNNYGVTTSMTYARPTEAALKKTDIFILIDPDYPKENKNPNYIETQDVQVIYDWVKKGGVLVMFGNDTGNMEFDHYNALAEKFGIRFNKDSRNRVHGTEFGVGTFNVASSNPMLKTARRIYLKEIATLNVTSPATALLSDNVDVIMAVSKVGKGTVFAVGDPWFYNEYVDGRKLPAEFENFKAAQDFVKWLLSKTKGGKNG